MSDVEGKGVVEQTIGQVNENGRNDEGIRVDDVKVEVSFRIGGKRLSISELRKIKKGEVLVLDAHVNDPVVMLVNGQPKLIGEVGEEDGRFVFITQEILR